MDENTFISANVLSVEIDGYRVKVDEAVAAELDKYKDSVFFLPLKRATEGGKRLRPILLILAFESVNNEKHGNPFPAAVAVELTHLESLIHDDIVDKDSFRRETAAFHANHGQEMALLSADFILSMILDITARYNDPGIAKALAKAASAMCEGQLEELKVYKNNRALDISDYVGIISKKTASLFEASAKIGAIIGDAQEDELETLSNYGKLLGTAYQIEDDIADLTKTTKINLLTLVKTEADKIKHLREKSKAYIIEAKQNLERLQASEAKRFLLELADFIISPSINRL
jgi:octaprenyl-diphosphate synthase